MPEGGLSVAHVRGCPDVSVFFVLGWQKNELTLVQSCRIYCAMYAYFFNKHRRSFPLASSYDKQEKPAFTRKGFE